MSYFDSLQIIWLTVSETIIARGKQYQLGGSNISSGELKSARGKAISARAKQYQLGESNISSGELILARPSYFRLGRAPAGLSYSPGEFGYRQPIPSRAYIEAAGGEQI